MLEIDFDPMDDAEVDWLDDEFDQPAIPDELWMLWYPAGNQVGCGVQEGFWARAIDGAPNDLHLVCKSEAEAIEAAAHQNAHYDLDRPCRPVRVK